MNVNDFGRLLAANADDTSLELVVATITGVNPFTIDLNGMNVVNPSSLLFTPVVGATVMCIGRWPSIFVLGPIVNRS